MQLSVQLTATTKTGDDECEEGEKERRRSSEIWDLDSLVHLVSEEDEEDQERHHEKAVAQGRVSGRPALVSIDIRHPEEDPSEDDGVEDTHQGDAEHYPEWDEGDLPGPGDNAATKGSAINNHLGLTSWISLVQFESQKYELKDIDSTEQLQLKRPVMSDTPHTDGNTDDADDHQWYENQDPLKKITRRRSFPS